MRKSDTKKSQTQTTDKRRANKIEWIPRTSFRIQVTKSSFLLFIFSLSTIATLLSGPIALATPAPDVSLEQCKTEGGTWQSDNSSGWCSIAPKDRDPELKAQAWAVANAFYRCVANSESDLRDNTPVGQRINEEHMRAGIWFKENASYDPMLGAPHKVASSFLIDNVGERGETLCNNLVKEAADLTGYGTDYRRMFCDVVPFKADGTSCTGNSGDFSGTGRKEGQLYTYAKDFYEMVKRKAFRAETPPLSDDAKYLLYLSAFTAGNGCHASPTASPGSNENKIYRNIKILNSTGTDFDIKTFEGEIRTDKRWVYTDQTGQDQELQCQQIADQINANAAAFLVWAKQNPDKAPGILNNLGTKPTGTATDKPTCSIDAIGWIVCPVINFLAGLADGAFNFLADNFLKVDVKAFDTSSQTYTVWNGIRNLANVGLVIALLFIIFSQLSSIGLSNYGIKKMLPRILIAAILINLSYFICQLAVDVSNILGYSLKGILTGLSTTQETVAGGTSPFADGSGFVGIAGGVIATGLTGVLLYTLLSTLVPVLLVAVVALVMIMFILVARQAIIILLIIVAPLAFLAYLLPNTEQWFSKWRKAFTTVLLLFPIIALVFGASSIASTILSTVFTGGIKDDTNNWFGQMIAAVALVLPLFIVPALLKKSLDGIGTVGAKMNGIGGKAQGFASKGGQKAYDNSRIGQFKKYRDGERAIRRAKIQSGTYEGRGGKFNPRNLASSMNQRFNQSSRSGKFGDRALANGAAIENNEDNELMKNAEARLSLMSFEPDVPLTQAQAMQIATGQHVTNAAGVKIADKSTFDEHTRRAAIKRAAKIATVAEAHTLVDAAGAKDAAGNNIMHASERKELAAALVGSSAAGKAPYLMGKTLGAIEAGSSDSLVAAKTALTDGKINAEALSVGDVSTISKLLDAAKTTSAGSPERIALKAAYAKLNAPGSRLREKIVGGGPYDTMLKDINTL